MPSSSLLRFGMLKGVIEEIANGGLEQSGQLEVGGDLHDLVVGPEEARSLIGGARHGHGDAG